VIFTLDDGAKDKDRESLGNRIMAMLDALNHAQGALRDIIVPTGQVFAWSCLLIFSFIYFYFLITCLFSSLLLLVAGRNPDSYVNTRKSGTASSMRHGCIGT